MARGRVGEQDCNLTYEATQTLNTEHADIVTVMMTVTLVKKNGEKMEGTLVHFFSDGSKGPVFTEETNEHGRASIQEVFIGYGKHLLVAIVCGSSLSIQHTMNIQKPKEEKKKIQKPQRVNVFLSGLPGKQCARIMVTDENGEELQGYTVTVLDGDNPPKQWSTNEIYSLNFSESQRRFRVIAGIGKFLKWQWKLPGPKP